jgi:hypothetical protein
MSGRGRGAGRGGRGNGRSNGSGGRGYNQNQPSKKPQKLEKKFQVSGSGGGHATFTVVKETMVQELQKEFGVEIATTIRTMKKYDFDQDKPKREISSNTDKALKEQEDADNMVFFERKVDEFIKRENQYKRDLLKVYSTIYTDYCTEGMQRRIRRKYNKIRKF